MAKGNKADAAERAARGRATVMAIAAVVLLVNAAILVGSPPDSAPTLRGGMWIILVGLWLLILATGGALTRKGATVRMMKDELSLQNRARAIAFGFNMTMAAALGLYVASWFHAFAPHDLIRLVTAAGIASALARYAWLEIR